MGTHPFIEQTIKRIGRLPGLGPRSARRIILHLLQNKETHLLGLLDNLNQLYQSVETCHECGNLDITSPCQICTSPNRSAEQLCIVETVADLWAMERTASFQGRYRVLGGVLSAANGIGPEDLGLDGLVQKIEDNHVQEVVIALNAQLESQTTAHYIWQRLQHLPIQISQLAHGLPMGGELDYLDDGTIITALNSRKAME